MSESEIPAVGPTRNYDPGAVARARAVLDAPPEQIGPYRILERLGGGGMGEVYRAEQRSPIRREVALKLIKLGMDTKLVIARFEAERQALAMMDHPHIAKVFDAGAEDTGRPYFIMEYVKGRPITEYADQNHLTIQERLELFQQVCQGIQHAHQKGIIHRDLKPSNVLVSTGDGKPFAKVIDFGIAKAIAQPLTEKTLFTQHEQLLGTPLYMSPEQAEGSLDIDTRTDVYSLGVLLYELLTGSTPFGSEELKAAAVEQIKKMIREVDPPKPSTRISMSGQTLPTLAASRRTEPKKLGTLVRGELDWIVMKSLEKDRARRYDTPTSLADDIQRYLTGQPVVAAPPSWTYRVRKYVRRRKGAVAAIAAIVVLLVGGTLISSLLAVRARRAERQVQDQIVVVEQEKTEAQHERDQSMEANQRANRMLSELCVDTGIAAMDRNEAGLAMLWFVKAMKLDAGDLDREEIQRRRIGAVYLQHPRPVEIVPPDVPGIVKNGLSLQWGPNGVKVVEARTGKPVGPPLDYDHGVRHAEFSPDGKYVVGACEDVNARVWEVATGKVIAGPMPHSEQWIIEHEHVNQIRFTPDGKRIVTLIPIDLGPNGQGLHVQLRNALTGEPIGKGFAVGGSSYRVNSYGDRVILSFSDSSLGIHDLLTGEQVVPAFGHDDSNSYIFAFSPDGKHVATGSGGGARVWEVATGKPVTPPLELHERFAGLPAFPRVIVFSPDGKLLLCSGYGTWQLWNAETGAQLFQVQQSGNAYCAIFSPDGSRIATTSTRSAESNCLVIRDATSGSPVASPIVRAAVPAGFSEDGKYLVSIGTANQRIETWDVEAVNPAGPCVEATMLSAGGMVGARFNQDGKYFLTTTSSIGNVQVWDAANGGEATAPLMFRDEPWFTAERYIDLDGRWLDRATGQVVEPPLKLPGEPTPRPLAASYDLQYVLAAQGSSVGVWEAKTGRCITPILSQGWSDSHYTFSPDGTRLAVGNSSEVQIWDLRSGKLVLTQKVVGFFEGVRFSPDGKYLVLEGPARSVNKIINAVDGHQLTLSNTSYSDLPNYAAFSADGAHIVWISGAEAQVWDITSETATSLPLEHSSNIRTAAFSRDGRYVVTGDEGGAMRVWDAGSGKPITPFMKVDSFILDANFSADNNRMVTAYFQETAVWDFRSLAEPLQQLQLFGEYLAGERLDETGNRLRLSEDEILARREKLLVECPELFRIRPQIPPKSKGVPENYRAAVEAEVDAAKSDEARKRLSMSFSHSAEFERQSTRLDEAIFLARTAEKLDPSSLEAEYQLAAAYLMAHRYDEALAIYEKYKGQHYNDEALAEADRYQRYKAQHYNKEFYELYNPDDKDVVFGIRIPELIAQLRDDGQDDPTLAKIEALLAASLAQELGVPEHYRTAVETEVASAKTDEARKELAVKLSHGADFERHSGCLDKAILLAENAVKLDPSSLEAEYQLAAADLMTHRYDEALAIYEKCKGQHYNGEWYHPDEKDVVVGVGVPKIIADLRNDGHDSPTLAKIEAVLAPTLHKKSGQPAADHPVKEESKADQQAKDKPNADQPATPQK